MILLKGTIENGQVVLPQPVELADGTEVTVLSNGRVGSLGIPDEEWPTAPEDIARLIARMEQVEPFEMSPQEALEKCFPRQELPHALEWLAPKDATPEQLAREWGMPPRSSLPPPAAPVSAETYREVMRGLLRYAGEPVTANQLARECSLRAPNKTMDQAPVW